MCRQKLIVLACMLACLSSRMCHGETLTYRPGPEDGVDMWYSSNFTYDGSNFVDDQRLRVGGWGDSYWTLIKFDLGCLPRSASFAYLYLMPYDAGGGATPVSMSVYRLTKEWDEQAGWTGDLYGVSLGTLPAPTPGTWYGIDITSIYNNWQSGTYSNYGFAFLPTANDNRFNTFRSSDYVGDETQRPKLIIGYNPDPSEPFKLCFPLKRPLDGPYTSEITAIMDHNGGSILNGIVEAYNGETGSVNRYDYGGNVFGYQRADGRDFSLPLLNYCDGVSSGRCGKKWLFYDGHTGYDYRASLGVQVYATAAGTATVTNDKYNTLTIDHGNGYQTYYLHMSSILVGNGQQVKRGQLVGKVGDIGASAPHLHMTIKRDTARIDPYGRAGVNGILWDE